MNRFKNFFNGVRGAFNFNFYLTGNPEMKKLADEIKSDEFGRAGMAADRRAIAADWRKVINTVDDAMAKIKQEHNI